MHPILAAAVFQTFWDAFRAWIGIKRYGFCRWCDDSTGNGFDHAYCQELFRHEYSKFETELEKIDKSKVIR